MKTLYLIITLIGIAIPSYCLNGIDNNDSSDNKTWISGRWEGDGYQIDCGPDNHWKIDLIINQKKQIFSIRYPSLDCSGNWKLVKLTNDVAVFEELISRDPKSNCLAESKIILTRIDSSHIIYSAMTKDADYVSSFATLRIKKKLE